MRHEWFPKLDRSGTNEDGRSSQSKNECRVRTLEAQKNTCGVKGYNVELKVYKAAWLRRVAE